MRDFLQYAFSCLTEVQPCVLLSPFLFRLNGQDKDFLNFELDLRFCESRKRLRLYDWGLVKAACVILTR
jgi:hypothetical protein